MRHGRGDYQRRIQDAGLADPSLLLPGETPIGEDEPVFLLRARDISAPVAVRAWARLQPLGSAAADQARAFAQEMSDWQQVTGLAKQADLPASGSGEGT